MWDYQATIKIMQINTATNHGNLHNSQWTLHQLPKFAKHLNLLTAQICSTWLALKTTIQIPSMPHTKKKPTLCYQNYNNVWLCC